MWLGDLDVGIIIIRVFKAPFKEGYVNWKNVSVGQIILVNDWMKFITTHTFLNPTYSCIKFHLLLPKHVKYVRENAD